MKKTYLDRMIILWKATHSTNHQLYVDVIGCSMFHVNRSMPWIKRTYP